MGKRLALINTATERTIAPEGNLGDGGDFQVQCLGLWVMLVQLQAPTHEVEIR